MSKVICCDVDGTLANCEHRQHYVRQKPKRWDLFNKNMHLDTPYQDIVWLINLLYNAGNTIVICSGREDSYRSLTEDWLATHGVPYHFIYMRKAKDARADYIIKTELLNEIRANHGEPFIWLDDRNSVVTTIRSQGVRVLQVQDGNF